ncbi:MAG: extracellular solute-binding protein [Ruminococcaceae bacterium]|nr:extracellular solute-binding protein [Oscillospiraceae bacterium]
MLGTKLKRLVAGLLCFAMLLGGSTVIASASGIGSSDEEAGSVTDTSLSELKELLNAISYDEYEQKATEENVPKADSAIEVPIADFTVENGDGFEMKDVLGEKALYTPQDGAVSWTVNVETKAKYAIKIVYYPDHNRSTSIERILKINDEVPFAEARFLSMPKNWVNQYANAVYTPKKGESATGIADDARTAGFKEVNVTEDNQVTIVFPGFFTEKMRAFCDTYEIRFFVNDINKNEIRPTAEDSPKWMDYYLRDSSGYYSDVFEFVLDAGENKITLEGQNEPMSIRSIILYPAEDVPTYEGYVQGLKDNGVDVSVAGKDTVRLEAEEFSAASGKTIYPTEDRSCAINSPSDVTRSVLNTMGGEKWATAGQWVEYNFKVESSGMYDIFTRFKQDVLDGMYTCRALYLYSNGEVAANAPGYYDGTPFSEAQKLVYDYSASWQVTALSNGVQYDSNGDGEINKKDKDVTYPVYLKEGVTYTLRMEVTLGQMGDIVRRTQESLNVINAAYLNIIKLTGTSPDAYRDYGFTQVMPDTMVDMVLEADNLKKLAAELTELAGDKSSNVATLEKIARLLDKMGKDDDEVAKNLANLKTNIGTLGTFLSDAQTQPLQLDYIQIQPIDAEKAPKAEPNFWQSLVHEIGGFFQSFFRDYNSMGALTETEEGSVEVWMESARDQSQVLRNLVNNGFTPDTGIAVDLKLVAGGTLLPSILAGSGPDVSLGRGQGDVINYAIRSALLNIDHFEDFEEVSHNFNEAAMLVLGIEDADEVLHYYGLPEVQGFPMMFLRTDILADLDLEIPKSWDDIMACIPVLQANNMQIGLSTDYKIFLYQQGGDLFADGGMRINLDSQLALASFEKMCNLFTMYSFPYVYNAANRFRTGEMPIVIGDYVGTYNQLKVFATEIQGKWEFLPLPGEVQADGSINNVSISGITACVMVNGCEEEVQGDAWEFMKWYTGKDCQVDYANEMVAILGPSGKQATANKAALAELPWTTKELEQVQLQFNNLASVPNYPGAYIIDRYTNFAFLSAYNDGADPSDSLMQHINVINKEIERKRAEFGLETLSDGTTDYKDLLTKRTAQVKVIVESLRDVDKSGEYTDLLAEVESALKSDDKAAVNAAVASVWAAYNAISDADDKYWADKVAVMGYDMRNTDLTKDQKRKLRKCYSYEVYENTDEAVTLLRCMAEFLGDVAENTKE